MEDISKALVYELKQDIANRYFGFRKQIETESNQYLAKLDSVDDKYTDNIAMDMQRMHCLLQNDQLFTTFIQFTGIPESIGSFRTDSQSPIQWRRLFANLQGKGFTRKKRFRNLVYTIYRLLADDVAAYRKMFVELEEECEDIRNEIKRFYRMNDLSGILNFLREVDNPDAMHSSLLYANSPTLAGQKMEEELRISPPPAATTRLPLLPQLPTLETAKPTLDSLISQAFELFDYTSLDKLPF